jgi:purine-binding chemotaxis protein CheW
VIGVLRLHGALIPVVDLRTRLGVPAAEPHIGECIVVLQTSTPGLGLLVEGVDGVVTAAAESLDRPWRAEERQIAGRVLEVSGHVVTALDLDAALGSELRAYLEALADSGPRLEKQAA